MPNSRLSRDAREDASGQRMPRGRRWRLRGAGAQVPGPGFRRDLQDAGRPRGGGARRGQETFIKAYQGLHGFDARMPIRAWLMRIATNASIRPELRRRNRRREVKVDMGAWGRRTPRRGRRTRHSLSTPRDRRLTSLRTSACRTRPGSRGPKRAGRATEKTIRRQWCSTTWKA